MKLSRSPLLLAMALVATAPLAATAAEGVSYNYVQGGYVATNGDGADADGFGVDGSFAVHPNFHVFGGYSNQEIDGTDFDFDQWRAGVGYNHQISPKADLLARVAYEKFDAGRDLFGDRIEADGYSAEVGVRGALAQHLEGYALAGFEDYGSDVDGDFYGRLGANVKFNQSWSINGDVKFAGDDTQWFVGPRLSW
ncbi:Ax21 family protein [Luteimonas vadosa]|uniref:Ax21 family protein n=1 Tax=Luteimonas vadosa TaxID=1165507 RepID=A0ABP9DRA9_9GAMM